MNKFFWLSGVIFLLVCFSSTYALRLEQHENMTVDTLKDYVLSLNLYTENVPAQKVMVFYLANNTLVTDEVINSYHTFVRANTSIAINGVLNNYYDNSNIVNYSWKKYNVNIKIYEPGDYVFIWGLNFSKNITVDYLNNSNDVNYKNISNINSSFIIHAYGNSSLVNRSVVAYNMTDLWSRPEGRYGSTSKVDVVKQRLQATEDVKKKLELLNKSNISKVEVSTGKLVLQINKTINDTSLLPRAAQPNVSKILSNQGLSRNDSNNNLAQPKNLSKVDNISLYKPVDPGDVSSSGSPARRAEFILISIEFVLILGVLYLISQNISYEKL
jgi:hypothetical protein